MIDLAIALLWSTAQLAALHSPRLSETMTVTAAVPAAARTNPFGVGATSQR